MDNRCPECKLYLILCPADLPWHEEYWICPKCDATFVYEEKK